MTELKKPRCALLIVDVQNDFISGSLALPKRNCQLVDGKDLGAEIVVPRINKLLEMIQFDEVVYSMDWHPHDHISFIRNGQDNLDFGCDDDDSNVDKWPVHCVQNSWGAKLHQELQQNPTGINPKRFTIRKGTDRKKENYSAFFDQKSSNIETNLALRLEGIETILVCGLALDICVAHTALDSAQLGFRTKIIEDCSYALDAEGMAKLRHKLQQHGIEFIDSQDLLTR